MTHEVICEIAAALLKAPRIRPELEEMCLGGRDAQLSALAALRSSGLVRICDWRRAPRLESGRLSDRRDAVFEFQITPFAAPDVPRPRSRSKRRHDALRMPQAAMDTASRQPCRELVASKGFV